jgi:mannose-1-phosphate guanylyltransferase
MAKEKLAVHAVILAGGRGTRFWPRSRTRTPKQLLNIVGKDTMLQQTVARLKPLIPGERIWTVTNSEQAVAVRKQVPAAARKRVLIEPVGLNTAVAIGLAAIHVRHAARGDALMAVLPADHYIEQPQKFREIMNAALDVAREPGRMVVLGVPPTRPETGFGYIERTGEPIEKKGFPVFAVRRFTEKPELKLAQEYVASGNSLERRDVFLAGFHVSRESEKFSAKNARRAGKTR